MAGGRTPAKPLWSEVLIFLDVFLLRQNLNRRKLPAPVRRALIGGQTCARKFSSYERMLAGAGCVVGG